MKKLLFTLLSLSLSLLTTCAEQEESPIDRVANQLNTFKELPKEITQDRLQAIIQLNSSVTAANASSSQTGSLIVIFEDIHTLLTQEHSLIADELPAVTAVIESVSSQVPEGLRESLMLKASTETLIGKYNNAIHDLQQKVSSIGEKVLESSIPGKKDKEV